MEIKTTAKKMSSGFDNFINGIANDLRNELVTTCPVDTGNLKNSIIVDKNDRGYNILMPDYGLMVEYGCFFDKNTKILTNKGEVSIKNLKKGDFIWNGYDYYPLIQKQKYEYMKNVKEIIIKTKKGNLKVTEEHPILTIKGWKKAINVKKGDMLISLW